MNRSFFVGTLCKDFETTQSASGVAFAKSSMALNRGKDKDGNDRGADFVNLVAFGKTAETLAQYGKKGKRFAIECHVQTGSYEKDGKKIYTTDFVIEHFEFADSKGNEPAEKKPEEFITISDSEAEELPF